MPDLTDRPVFVLTRHWLSLVGVALVTTAVVSWLFVLPLQIRGHVDNPYIGIVVFPIRPVLPPPHLHIGHEAENRTLSVAFNSRISPLSEFEPLGASAKTAHKPVKK
jgi:hypothetical protein